MAHLSISKNISFDRLVKLNAEYRNKLAAATDVFEKAELFGMIDSICDFCFLRGGWNYLNAVKQGDRSLINPSRYGTRR